MAFKMILKGIRLPGSLYREMRKAERSHTHGDVSQVEAVLDKGDCRVVFRRKGGERVRDRQTFSSVSDVKDLGDGRYELTTSEGVVKLEGVESVSFPEHLHFLVTMKDGRVRDLKETRLFNLVHADIVSEPARRAGMEAR